MISVLVGLLVAVGSSTAAGAVGESVTEETGPPENMVAVSVLGSETTSPTSEIEPRALCKFYTQADYVHVSSTPPAQASGHGWWMNSTCPAGTTAIVTVQLQKRNVLGIWVNVGTKGTATVAPGGGAGKRATGRYTCKDSTKHQFRSIVDVDLVGLNDTPETATTPEQTLACN